MDEDDAPYRREHRPEFRGSDPRRSGRESEPLDQRLDRWVSAGRQFVDGVAGSRPGSRPPARGAEARGGEGRGSGRGGFDGLGRWVEERLDWLLEDGDDWREPWQDTGPRSPSPPLSRPNARNLSNPDTRFNSEPRFNTETRLNSETRYNPADLSNPSNPSSTARSLSPTNPASADQRRNQASRTTTPYTNPATAADSTPRRRLEALSRRGLAPQPPAAAAADGEEAWPDDDSFSLPRWQRPAATGRTAEPPPPAAETFEAGGRPLPRSSRRTSRRL